MYGLNPDNIVLEPKVINGDVYVPYYIETEMGEMATYLEYEVVKENLDTDGDDFDTDDFRYDGGDLG